MQDLEPGGDGDQERCVGDPVNSRASLRLDSQAAGEMPVQDVGRAGEHDAKPHEPSLAQQGEGPQDGDENQPRGAQPVGHGHIATSIAACYLAPSSGVPAAKERRSTHVPQPFRLLVIPIAAAVVCSLAVAAVIAANRPVLVTVRSATTSSGIDSAIFASGDATVSKKPDLALLSAGIESHSSSAAAAQTDLASKAGKLIARIKALGVADKDLSTSGYGIGPEYGSSGQAVTGYRAGEQLQVKWHNVDTVGKTLDAIVQEGGATNISVGFGLANPKAAQAEARALAIADARTKAQAMASAAGVQLGQVIRVSDVSSYTRTPYPISYGAALAAPDKAVTQVPVGDLDVQVSVEVDYAIG
jgi:uncharacterized protein YggE